VLVRYGFIVLKTWNIVIGRLRGQRCGGIY
jgi:hypothetical protein